MTRAKALRLKARLIRAYEAGFFDGSNANERDPTGEHDPELYRLGYLCGRRMARAVFARIRWPAMRARA